MLRGTSQVVGLHLVDNTRQKGPRKRKTLREVAPVVAAAVPDLLRRTRDLDYVAKESCMVTSHALAAAVCYLLDQDWLRRRAA
jgi:hypothetical protein